MTKNKFSTPGRSGARDTEKKSFRSLQEDETAVLPKSTANPLDTMDDCPNPDAQRHTMPEVDFMSFADLEQAGSTPGFPELTALDPQQENAEYSQRFSSIPPHHSETEEEAIEKAFAQTAEQPRRRKEGPGFLSRHKKGFLLTLLVILLALGVTVSGLFLYRHLADPYDHQILHGVEMAGVELGGMTRPQAQEALEAAASSFLYHSDMQVRLPEHTITLSPAATRIHLDAKAAVKAAYSFGRTGTPQEREQAYRDSLTETTVLDLRPFLSADLNYLRMQLQGYADAHDSGYTPSSYALEGEQPPLDLENFNKKNTPQTLLLILGSPGFHLDVEAAAEEIMDGYAQLNLNLQLKLSAGNQEPVPLDLPKIHEEYTIEPVNSSMDRESYEIISGSYGYTFNLKEAEKLLAQAHYGETVRVPMEYVEPDTMDHEVYFQDVLGRAETKHGNNPGRNTNLSLACQALDGLVLNPGDEFSYNATLGQRTAEKGYQPAPAYSGKTLIDSLGGGICQVSSTLYYSCLLADLEITDRINHGFLPTYIDPGMDATVSWGKPDFKFRNNTSYPIRLHAEATDELVIVEILGTDDKDYYVKMEYEMSDVYLDDIYQEYGADSGYYDGQVIDSGRVGHSVKTYRCKYSKKTDVLLAREFETRSSYIAEPRIIASVRQPETQAPEPPATEPPATVPPETTPPETVPPVTDPPETVPQTVPPETVAPIVPQETSPVPPTVPSAETQPASNA